MADAGGSGAALVHRACGASAAASLCSHRSRTAQPASADSPTSEALKDAVDYPLDGMVAEVLDAAIQAIGVEATGGTTSTWIVSDNALSGSGTGDVAEAIFTNSGTGTVNLTLTGNSSANTPPSGEFNFDLLNTGGGGFTVDSSALNSGEVGSSDGSVVIP